jgi:hypothetical protein
LISNINDSWTPEATALISKEAACFALLLHIDLIIGAERRVLLNADKGVLLNAQLQLQAKCLLMLLYPGSTRPTEPGALGGIKDEASQDKGVSRTSGVEESEFGVRNAPDCSKVQIGIFPAKGLASVL